MNKTALHTIAASAAFAAATAAAPASYAAPVDANTLLYLSGGISGDTPMNESTAEGAATISRLNGYFSQVSDVSSATLCDGANGGSFTNTASLAVGGSVTGITVTDPAPTPYWRGSFTFECMFKVNSDSSQTGSPYFFSQSGCFLLQYETATRKVVLRNKDWSAIGSIVTSAGDWHHLAVVRDAESGKMSFYVDYSLVSSTAASLGDTDYSTFNFGARLVNDGLFNVKYDEVRLTKQALSRSEFLMNEAVAAKEKVLLDPCALFYIDGSMSGGTVENKATAATAASLAATIGTAFTQSCEVSSATFHNGVNGGSFTNTASLAAGGSTTAVQFTDSPQAPFCRTNYTFECIFKTTSTQDGSYLFYNNNGWMLQTTSSGTLLLRYPDWTTRGTSPKINDGEWHHVAVVQDVEAGKVSFYVDYRLVSKTDTVFSSSAPSAYFTIGAVGQNGGNALHNTTYDEVRLTKRVLSRSEFLMDDAVVMREKLIDDDTILYLGGAMNGDAPKNESLVEGAATITRLTGYFSTTSDVATATFYNGAFGEAHPNTESLAVGGSVTAITVTDPATTPYWRGNFTFECMFKVDSDSSQTGSPYFFSQSGCFLIQYETATRKVVLRNKDWSAIGSKVVSAGTWHHLAVVRDATSGNLSLYLDYALVSSTAASLGETDDSTFNFGARVVNDGLFNAKYDEVRLTKRALKPTEFIAMSPLAITDTLLFARYENSWAATDDGPYAVAAEPSGAAEMESAARATKEIQSAQREKLYDNGAGLSLAGGTVSYRGNGTLDAESATAEVFVRGQASAANANVVSFALANDLTTPVWSVAANGTVTVATATGSRTFTLSSLLNGAWHHLAVSYAPSGDNTAVKVWMDYVCVVNETVTGRIAFQSTAGFVLGSEGFTGAMDELRVMAGEHGASDFLYTAPPSGFVIIMK